MLKVMKIIFLIQQKLNKKISRIGYIKKGKIFDKKSNTFYVDEFKEKPSLDKTKEYLKNCSPKKRDEFLNMFKKEFEGFGFDADYDYPDIQNLSWEQIKEIDENPLFDIGGHTHNHEIMSYLSDAELASEIGTCLEQLEKNLGRKIYLFSYPEGQRLSLIHI